MGDKIKTLRDQIKQMEKDEVPDIDIEMAIQRKYPEFEHEIIKHDGKPERSGQKVRQCADTQGNYGMPCPFPAKHNCYLHQVEKGVNFPICSHHSYIAAIPYTLDDPQPLYFCYRCSIDYTFKDKSKQFERGTKMAQAEGRYDVWTEDKDNKPLYLLRLPSGNIEWFRTESARDNYIQWFHYTILGYKNPPNVRRQEAPTRPGLTQYLEWHKEKYPPPAPKTGKLTILQAAKLEKMSAWGDPLWVIEKRQQEAREEYERKKMERMRERRGPSKSQSPSIPMTPVKKPGDTSRSPTVEKNIFDELDDIFYAEYYGSSSSGDAGMRYGHERLPIRLYTKVMAPGAQSSRIRGPKWDRLTPSELLEASRILRSTYAEARRRSLVHLRNKD